MATNTRNNYRVSNIDYLAFKEESTKGTPAGVPDKYIKAQAFNLKPTMNKGEDTRMAGHKGARSDMLRGLRSYEGTMNLYAEPNFLYHVLDMLYNKSTTSGSDPYTTTYDCLSETEPISYTVDKALNGVVHRFAGVEATSLPFSYEEGDNVAHNEVGLRALNHFSSAKIVSATGGGPTTIVLDTDYDQNPTALLVVGDTLTALDVSLGTYTDLTIASIVDGTSITVTEDGSALDAGDYLYIKPQLVSGISWFSEVAPLEWGGLVVKKGAAIGTVAEFCAEPDTTINLIHNISDGNCSGVLHTKSLRRTTSDAEITINRLVDTGTDYAEFIDNDQQCYQFIWTRGSYSLTITFYAKCEDAEITPESNELETQSFTLKPIKDATTGNFFTVSLANGYDTT